MWGGSSARACVGLSRESHRRGRAKPGVRHQGGGAQGGAHGGAQGRWGSRVVGLMVGGSASCLHFTAAGARWRGALEVRLTRARVARRPRPLAGLVGLSRLQRMSGFYGLRGGSRWGRSGPDVLPRWGLMVGLGVRLTTSPHEPLIARAHVRLTCAQWSGPRPRARAFVVPFFGGRRPLISFRL